MSLSQAPPGKGREERGGKGAPSFAVKELSSGEFSPWKVKLNRESYRNAKEGHLRNPSGSGRFLGSPDLLGEAQGTGSHVAR